jgi:pyridoxamine 5'-phosphate oxidase
MKNWIDPNRNPREVFNQWFDKAIAGGNFEPTAMTLATLGLDGTPSARVVLLKHQNDQGFYFFTNYESTKGQELINTPKAALNFHWEKPLHRQVRIRGLVEKSTFEESTKYYQSRSRGSQVGAWASPQSQELTSRDELEKLVSDVDAKFKDQDPLPCPENWGGFVLKPLSIEFWQEGEFRLHDRMLFSRDKLEGPWKSQRLAP